jgi:hypothetical protein
MIEARALGFSVSPRYRESIIMSKSLFAAVLLAFGLLSASGQAQTALTPARLASLLEQGGYADIRSLVAEGGGYQVLARSADGEAVRAVVDAGRQTVEGQGGAGLFVRYAPVAASQMSFGELAGVLEGQWPGCTLVEVKRFQGAFEVHLRTADGRPMGTLVDAATRRLLPYHSAD